MASVMTTWRTQSGTQIKWIYPVYLFFNHINISSHHSNPRSHNDTVTIHLYEHVPDDGESERFILSIFLIHFFSTNNVFIYVDIVEQASVVYCINVRCSPKLVHTMSRRTGQLPSTQVTLIIGDKGWEWESHCGQTKAVSLSNGSFWYRTARGHES